MTTSNTKDILNIKLLIIAIIIIFTFGQVATDLYLPSMLSIAHSLGTTTDKVQLTITIYVASMMLSQPVYGISSDAYGRKPILLIGVILSLIGTVICYYSVNINHLLLGRFIQGLGVGVGPTVCRAIMRDLFKGYELIRMNSYLAIGGIAFMTAAPVVGGYIEFHLNWYVCFGILLGVSILNCINLIFLIPETNKFKDKNHIKLKTMISNIKSLLSSKKFLAFSLCTALANANVFAWVTSGSIILQKIYGLNPIYFGWCYFLSASMYIIGNLYNKNNVREFGINKMMLLGFSIQLVMSIILYISYLINLDNIFVVVGTISIITFGISLVFPNSTYSALVDFNKISGTASAVFSVIQTLGGVLASCYIALNHDQNIVPIAYCLILISLTGVITSIVINKLDI